VASDETTVTEPVLDAVILEHRRLLSNEHVLLRNRRQALEHADELLTESERARYRREAIEHFLDRYVGEDWRQMWGVRDGLVRQILSVGDMQGKNEYVITFKTVSGLRSFRGVLIGADHRSLIFELVPEGTKYHVVSADIVYVCHDYPHDQPIPIGEGVEIAPVTEEEPVTGDQRARQEAAFRARSEAPDAPHDGP
jgi:hypothetical protein